MTSLADRPHRSREAARPKGQASEWLTDWDPENEPSWDSGLAWRTLGVTTYTLTLAFITWFLVSAIAPRLNNIGFALSTEELYWLTAMPGLAGGLLRMVWMFLPPVLGTRKLVSLSTLLLAIPLAGWGWAVQNSDTPYGVLLALAFLCFRIFWRRARMARFLRLF